jgi:uncharacterized protein with PIN domain
VAGVCVRFQFAGELNDFLAPDRRNKAFQHVAGTTDTLKHVIESLGVPHTEIGSITVNGQARALSALVAQGDEVYVFPHTVPFTFVEPPRFVVDGHLGRLAAYLRMLGFDTWYERLADDEHLASISNREYRVLLTRDVGLLKRRQVDQGYCVRADKPHDQLREVSTRFGLWDHFAPFTRCMDCNGFLTPVEKSEIADLLPPHTRETKNEFSRCKNCGKIYWRGSHHARMIGWIRDLSRRAGS